MPILLPSHELAYFDTPKVASTSIKLALYKLEHGNEMEDCPNIDDAIHWQYPTHRLTNDSWEKARRLWKFGVVRDPMKRLLSAYANRVIHARDQYRGRFAQTRAQLLGLPLDPDPDTFFLRLARYRLAAGRIRHHTDRVDLYLGTKLSRLDAVYPIEELDRLAADLSLRTGSKVRFRRLQTGGPKITAEMLSPRAFDALMTYLEPEYRLLKDFYASPSRPDVVRAAG